MYRRHTFPDKDSEKAITHPCLEVGWIVAAPPRLAPLVLFRSKGGTGKESKKQYRYRRCGRGGSSTTTSSKVQYTYEHTLDHTHTRYND